MFPFIGDDHDHEDDDVDCIFGKERASFAASQLLPSFGKHLFKNSRLKRRSTISIIIKYYKERKIKDII